MSKHVALVVRWPTGGIRTYLKYVYPAILQTGWRATIIGPPDDEMEVLKQDLRQFGVGFAWEPRSNIFISIAASLRRVARESEVHVVHSHGLTSALAVATYARAARIPHLATLHDVFNAGQFSGMRGAVKRQLIALGLAQINVVQAVSKDARANLLEHIPMLRLRSYGAVIDISNGISSDDFASSQVRDLRAECRIPDGALLLGFLGRFMGQKGFKYLVEAIRLIKVDSLLDPLPVVVGVGDGGFIREEQESIRKLGLVDHFRFLPFVPNVAPTIKGCDLVVMPSLWEACPILAMEVLAAGVPLAGTSCIGLREVLEGTPATIFPPAQPVALANAILDVAGNLPETKRCAQAYAASAQERFDVRETSQRLRLHLDALSESG